MRQAYDMQDFAYETSMAIRKQLTQDGQVSAPDKETASAIGTLGKVWRDAQEQIRIHRGRPLPGSLQHERVTLGSKRSQRRVANGGKRDYIAAAAAFAAAQATPGPPAPPDAGNAA